jgi:hypothetical protein
MGEAVDRLIAELSAGERVVTREDLVALAPRQFFNETRDKLAQRNVAMPDGSFPIPDKDALRRAIRAIGRAKDRSAAMAHIKRRAKALGATDMLPDNWN